MRTTFFLLTSMAVFGTMANTVPSAMGVEVLRRDGMTIVREVVSRSEHGLSLNYRRRG